MALAASGCVGSYDDGSADSSAAEAASGTEIVPAEDMLSSERALCFRRVNGSRWCYCARESDEVFCSRLGTQCGPLSGTDNCGKARSVASCGTCSAPLSCGGSGTSGVCGCATETDTAFCARLGKECGPLVGTDNCGAARSVDCGVCAPSVPPPPPEATGTQLYVATSGSDSSPGTLVAPWRTIQKAMNSATPGATVNIRGGTYHERLTMNVSGTAGNFITFQPYGYTGTAGSGEAVFIDGSGGTGGRQGGWPDLSRFVYIVNKSYLRIQGLTFQNYTVTTGFGIRMDGGRSFEFLNNKVLHIKQVGDYYCDPSGASGICNYLSSFTFYGCGPDIVIRGNEFGDLINGWGEAFTFTGVNGFLVENNYMHDVDQIGMDFVQHSTNGTVRGNRFERTGYLHGGGAIYVSGGDHMVIERNIVGSCDYTSMPSWPIGIEVCSEGGYMDSTNIVIRNNVVYECAGGIHVGNFYGSSTTTVRDIQVYNNTLYKNRNSISMYPASNVLWANNLVADSVAHVVGTSAQGHVLDYNLFSSSVWSWYGATSTNALIGAPGFANTAASPPDVRISASSPAHDAGAPSAATDANAAMNVGQVDLAGQARIVGGRVDIGAHEVQ